MNQNSSSSKFSHTSILNLEQLCHIHAHKYPIRYFDDEREILHNDCKIVELREDECTIVASGEYQYDVSFDKITVLARPLNVLIDNILEDGNDINYELHCQLSEILNTNDCSNFVKALLENKYYAINVRKWKEIEEWLDNNHFDWRYNLIQNALAQPM